MSTRNQRALTPPMGWNSFDQFGSRITEAEAEEQATVMAARLLPSGYRYFVIDAGWYEWERKRFVDDFGRFVPAPNRFPSSTGGAGFKPLADRVHRLGLKFGIHIMRGIPRLAAEQNLPILGSSQRASDVANRSSVCPWWNLMWGST